MHTWKLVSLMTVEWPKAIAIGRGLQVRVKPIWHLLPMHVWVW